MMRAVIFDFDGLILDTESTEFTAFQHIFATHGLELPFDVWKACIGTDSSAFNPFVYLEQCLGRSIDHESIRELRARKVSELTAGLQPLPGVEDNLKRARELGLRIGLASSSPYVWVSGYLQKLGLIDYFECIRTADNVARVKPDPELYVQALSCLGVEPHEAIAFEDSPNGALAAKRAGMHCVAVPNKLTQQLVFGEIDLRMQTMDEMSLDEVIARLDRGAQTHSPGSG